MRDFEVTAEPSGASPAAHPGHSFVIQQHAARRMHYDFRLELDGVLLSWSVPKGPSLAPKTRRLAVRTEDHPLDYAGFEGIIPAGQYGGGAVAVWDRGSWEPEDDAQAGMKKGRLTFTLHGEKLTGRWHLVKTRGDGKAETWLLFKGRDDSADDQRDIIAERPDSVISGRTVDEIAAAPARVWQSNRAEAPTVAEKRAAKIAAAKPKAEATASGRVETAAKSTANGRARVAATKAAASGHATTAANGHATTAANGRATTAAKATASGRAKTAASGRAKTAAKASSASSRAKTAGKASFASEPAKDGDSKASGAKVLAKTTAAKVARPSRSQPATELTSLLGQLPLGFALTNLDKVLYPEQGVTKGELIAYLAVVADHALPHIARRPITLVRCPEGLAARGKTCFFQRHLRQGTPDAVTSVAIPEDDGGTKQYMQVHDMPGLVALAQLGSLEIHTWGAHAPEVEQPDLMVFDLDPDVGLPWDQVALAALELRGRLNELGLESFVKTTGGKGLHVVAPITRGIGWDDFKAFTKAVVEAMERDAPERFTTNMAKARRTNKIFLDYLRNSRSATFIAPYSPRARSGAPVAVPVSWEELAAGVDPAAFTTVTVPRRLATVGDPWAELAKVKQTITARAWRAVGGKPS